MNAILVLSYWLRRMQMSGWTLRALACPNANPDRWCEARLTASQADRSPGDPRTRSVRRASGLLETPFHSPILPRADLRPHDEIPTQTECLMPTVGSIIRSPFCHCFVNPAFEFVTTVRGGAAAYEPLNNYEACCPSGRISRAAGNAAPSFPMRHQRQ